MGELASAGEVFEACERTLDRMQVAALLGATVISKIPNRTHRIRSSADDFLNRPRTSHSNNRSWNDKEELQSRYQEEIDPPSPKPRMGSC